MDHDHRSYNIEGWYLPFFAQHLQDTRTRLGRRIASEADEDQPGPGDDVAEAHAPSAWTPAECDVFFRALSVHSRWRPDLIAACVPTKSEWDVWMYLEALEEGTARLAMEQEDTDMQVDGSYSEEDEGGSSSPSEEDENESSSDSRSRSASYMEEDDKGSSSDSCSRSGSSMDEDEEDGLPSESHPHMASVEDKELCEPALEVSQEWVDAEERMASYIIHEEYLMSLVYSGTVDADQGRPGGRERTIASTPTSGSIREALMRRLDLPHLQALDKILRDYEELNGEKMKTREVSEGPGMNTWLQLASSRGEGTSTTPAPPCTPDPGDAGPNPEPTADGAGDASQLSPSSRRRLQKRLYMRRKRALEKGGVYEDDGNAGMEKLKPGKKAKPDRSDTPAVPTSAVSEAPSDTELESGHKKRKSGLRLPYKLQARFAELDVDAAYLRSQGMDLLNMGALGRLLELRASLELPEEETDVAQFIDAELVQHLQAAMVLFVTDVLYWAIERRERELRLKARSRVWRPGDQMTIDAIEHAIQVVGARHRSHKEYFRSLEATITPANANTGHEAVDPDVGAPEPFPDVHRDTYGPLVCPPPAWGLGPLSCFTRTYEQEAARTRRGRSEEEEAELMSDTTDTSALEAELADDDAEDKRDTALGQRKEAELWGCLLRNSHNHDN